MNTTLTRGEAKDTIDFAIEQYINEIEVSDGMLETITYAVNNDLQIRDYFLGLPSDYGMQVAVDFVNYLTRVTNNDECYAYDTISAMYQIEQGNTEFAKSLLAVAESINPDYNLMKLAKRIISAEWDGKMLTQMRNELHSSVVDTITEEPNILIGEVA